MPRPPAPDRAAARPRDAGTTIVEVVVAAVLLGMLVVVATTVAVAGQSASVANRSRVVAAGLAARELDFARQRLAESVDSVTALVAEGSVRNAYPLDGSTGGGDPYVVDGMAYTVERTAVQRVPGSTSPCAGGAFVERLVTEVTVSVTWEAMGTARPYVLRQVFAPHRDEVPLEGKALVGVRVVDHVSAPADGVQAVVTGSSGAQTVTTDASGCAVAVVDADGHGQTVTVELVSSDRVDPVGQPAPVNHLSGVVAGELRTTSFTYARSGSLVVSVLGPDDEGRMLALSDPGGNVLIEGPDEGSLGRTFTLTGLYPGTWGVVLHTGGTPSGFDFLEVPPGGSATTLLVAP